MTSGPPPEPITPDPRPDETAQGPDVTYSAPAPRYQQPRPGLSAPSTGGAALAVAALLFGVLGCVVPFLPFDMTGVRPYVAFPFALAGLACGIGGCFGRRAATPLAVIGTVLSAIALIVGLIMFYNQVIL